ncbi:hypothetical protein G7Y89_g8020 [Cudoniella acicularis]|uniref:MARVEL domain-containing protein n=1 Tax=Cudoniella acicularis TaxID=354080 RepID=A0A8H4RI89_9HELO|nr:hypothetical protein G7Y89_g8020 [Cudoniella acicularis]
MGTASTVINVILRFGELCSAAIVLGILSRFTYLVDQGHGSVDSKIIYAMTIAGISIVFSIIFFPPLRYVWWCFPLDFAIFIMWMVAFGLLENVGGGACNSFWSWNYWGYYWGGYYVNYSPAALRFNTVNYAGCSTWRTMLAFGFIGGMGWLVSSMLGVYKIATRNDKDEDAIARNNLEVGNQKGPINGGSAPHTDGATALVAEQPATTAP